MRRAFAKLGAELDPARESLFQTALQKTRNGAYWGYDFKVPTAAACRARQLRV